MTTTALDKVRPSRALAALEEEMQRFMDGFFGHRPAHLRTVGAAVIPQIEMYDHEDEIVVKAEVPGVEKSEVQVTIDGDMLLLKGERKRQNETNEHDLYLSEHSYGAFCRSVWIPVQVKTDKVTAVLSNGVLEVHLPKAEEAKRKHATVEVK